MDKAIFCKLWRVMIMAVTGLPIIGGYAAADPSIKDEPVMVFEFHGANRGRGSTEFILSVFASGTVGFEGMNLTHVTGKAFTKVGSHRVAEWLQALVDNGVLERPQRPDYVAPPGAEWYRLTVSANGRRSSFVFHGWNTSLPLVRVLDSIMKEIDVLRRWVQYPKSE
jgi:hypothetical protein